MEPLGGAKVPTERGILKKLGLLHLHPTFLHHEIDVEVLLSVSDDDLAEIGVEDQAERVKILQFVKRYKT